MYQNYPLANQGMIHASKLKEQQKQHSSERMSQSDEHTNYLHVGTRSCVRANLVSV